MKRALVIGSGITGLSCARLLACQGWEVQILTSSANGSPTLLLNQVTRHLLQDIWQLGHTVWQSSHLLHRRHVVWGESNATMNLPHPDAAIKGRQLVDFLLKRLCQDFPKLISVDCFSAYQGQWSNSDGLQQIPKKFSWIIDASGRAAAISQRLGSGPSQAFGHRCVIAQEVILLKDCEETNYWIETVTNAWILLAPLGGQRALLQVMVPYILATPAQLLPHVLKQSLKIKQQISDLVGLPTTFSAFPQILPSLSGPIGVSDATWIAVGDAAFCVDPISGDGTGYAIREAILATSIINRMSGNPAGNSDSLHHYSLRLRQAFLAHLKACMSYYSASFSTLSWDAEIGLMRKAFADHISNQYQPQKWMQRLQGLELIDIGNPII